eukprot:Rmarinus@m.20994
MGGSSLRNAVKRKIHKERHQPAARKKFGLLEKHKDYVLRAKDYHFKQKRLSKLQEKASFRNPDEFYHEMIHSRVREGVHRKNAAPSIEAGTLKILKSQDYGYVSHKLATERNKIERLQGSLNFLGASSARHVILTETADEAKNFDPAVYFDTPEELVHRSYNRPRRADLAKKPILVMDDRNKCFPLETCVSGRSAPPASGKASVQHQEGGLEEAGEDMHLDPAVEKMLDRAERKRAKAYFELAARIKREGKLESLREDLVAQRNQMGKGSKKKVRDGENGRPALFRWKKERKR